MPSVEPLLNKELSKRTLSFTGKETWEGVRVASRARTLYYLRPFFGLKSNPRTALLRGLWFLWPRLPLL
jgi:hypothetical protein